MSGRGIDGGKCILSLECGLDELRSYPSNQGLSDAKKSFELVGLRFNFLSLATFRNCQEAKCIQDLHFLLEIESPLSCFGCAFLPFSDVFSRSISHAIIWR